MKWFEIERSLIAKGHAEGHAEGRGITIYERKVNSVVYNGYNDKSHLFS